MITITVCFKNTQYLVHTVVKHFFRERILLKIWLYPGKCKALQSLFLKVPKIFYLWETFELKLQNSKKYLYSAYAVFPQILLETQQKVNVNKMHSKSGYLFTDEHPTWSKNTLVSMRTYKHYRDFQQIIAHIDGPF